MMRDPQLQQPCAPDLGVRILPYRRIILTNPFGSNGCRVLGAIRAAIVRPV